MSQIANLVHSWRQRGFSLTGVIVAAGILSGISLIIAQLSKQQLSVQSDATAMADYNSLLRESSFFISDNTSCTVSLRGRTFRGSSIAATPLAGVEIWSADQAGVRSRKKFYDNSKWGKLDIEAVTLSMPDYTAATDFPAGAGQFHQAVITFVGKKNTMSTSRSFRDIEISTWLVFDTNASGESTIVECGLHDLYVKQQACDTLGWVFSPSLNPQCREPVPTVYDTPGTDTYVVPSDVFTIRVTGTGGGGGGWMHGPNPGGDTFFSGSGGGGVVNQSITVVPGESLDVVVGLGGVAGANGFETNLKRGATLLVQLGGGLAGGMSQPLGGTGTLPGTSGISQGCGWSAIAKAPSGAAGAPEIGLTYGYGGGSECDYPPAPGAGGYLSILAR